MANRIWSYLALQFSIYSTEPLSLLALDKRLDIWPITRRQNIFNAKREPKAVATRTWIMKLAEPASI